MKKITVLSATCITLALSQPVSAAVCDLDPQPAATLLLPYFEVGDGVTTLFSINNAAPEPALVLVTLWTDWGAPTLWFNVYLTGFDVVRINLADVFAGDIPITADDQSDPDDTVSPNGGAFLGAQPEWEGSFPDCEQFFPFFENPVVSGTGLERLVNGHTGQPVAAEDGQCLGGDHGDGVARGYVTVDSVNRCTLTFMDDPEFFAAEDGIANGNNVLWGDFFLVDTETRWSTSRPSSRSTRSRRASPFTDATPPGAPTSASRSARYGRRRSWPTARSAGGPVCWCGAIPRWVTCCRTGRTAATRPPRAPARAGSR